MLIHTHHTAIPCIELIATISHSLVWLWNPSSFPAAPSSIHHLFRAFVNTEQNIRAFRTQKRNQVSFLPSLRASPPLLKKWSIKYLSQNCPQRTRESFPLSVVLDLVTHHATLLPYSYLSPFVIGQMLIKDCPSLTDKLSTEGRKICLLSGLMS